MKRILSKWALISTAIVMGILPASCERELLQNLTPHLLRGDNPAVVDFIFAAAPFVLP